MVHLQQPFVWKLLLIIIGVNKVISNSLVEYDDLKRLEVSCHPKDTCRRIVTINFGNRSCECDPLCHRYDDCCVDAPDYTTSQNFIDPNLQLNCYEYAEDLGVYAITLCSPQYNGPEEIRKYCETQEDVTNPAASSPVIDISTNVTYKNHYCAECNNVLRYNLKSWNFEVECDKPAGVASIDSSYVLERIFYHNSEESEEASWGFYYPPGDTNQFYHCKILFKKPESLNIRDCRPHVISSCASNFTRQIVRRKCESYMAVILITNNFYRNAHCALCNYANLTNSICRVPGPGINKRNKPPLAFTVLMDVNTGTGNTVGRNDRCPESEVYDPFAKKCRTVYCIPGFKLVNGECTSASS